MAKARVLEERISPAQMPSSCLRIWKVKNRLY